VSGVKIRLILVGFMALIIGRTKIKLYITAMTALIINNQLKERFHKGGIIKNK
jgi:hypothetical protein